jgi:ankyrin repeat protein
MMHAAHTSNSNLSMLRLLLQHSANPDLQSYEHGRTALMIASTQGQEAHVKALLQEAGANSALLDTSGFTALQHAEAKGHTAIAELIRQHAARPCAQHVASPDASEATRSSLTSLPEEILASAMRGELQKVAKWLRKGGAVDALGSVPTVPNGNGRTTSSLTSLLHAAATNGRLEMVRELLKRGASVDLPTSLGNTALMGAAYHGHLSILLVLLQHSANPDLQANNGQTALMMAARQGHGACVQALLRAKAGTELLHMNGFTALKFAKAEGHAPIAELIRQHAVPTQPAAPPKASEATWSSVAPLPEETLASAAADSAGWVRRAAGAVEDDATPGGPRAEGAVPLAWPWVILSLVLGAIASVAFSLNLLQEAQQEAERKAKQESAAEAVRLAAADQAREVVALVAAREVAALVVARAAQEASWMAAQLPAQEAAQRGLAAARVAAASKAREVAVTAAAVLAAAAEAEANTLERAATDGGEGGSSGTASASEVSEEAVPDQYMCSITAEIMTDPVITVRALLYTILRPVALHSPTASLSPLQTRYTGGRIHLRAQRHRELAQDPRHLACDGRRAREQAAHPVPLSPQPHPRVYRAEFVESQAMTSHGRRGGRSGRGRRGGRGGRGG